MAVDRLSVVCPDALSTGALGGVFAQVLEPGDVIVLSGELGAGKTTLVKGLVGALRDDIDVTSPTFVLCHLYETTPPIAHVDCWRMDDPNEIVDLALEEGLDDGGVVIAEWGDPVANYLGDQYLRVALAIGADLSRRATLSFGGERWKDRAPTIKDLIGAIAELTVVTDEAMA